MAIIFAGIDAARRNSKGKPLMCDLFAGAGGAARGYQMAGFYVVGVDIKPQKRYAGDEFVQADAMTFPLEGFDVIHASPPCQRFSFGTARWKNRRQQHPDLLTPILSRLKSKPVWIVENVIGSPLSPLSVQLCGLFFRLKVFRHRLFESSFMFLTPPHISHTGKRIGVDGMVCVAGHGDAGHGTVSSWKRAMGIDWMTRDELAQAIPPAYTEWIGKQLLSGLK